MSFLDKMERKFGRYAIHNLPAIIIALYVAGYIMEILAPEIISYLMLSPVLILRGQVWRVISWVIVPPSNLNIFTLIMLFFYYSVGKQLERTWGAFRFNAYIFSGIVFTVIGAFILHFVGMRIGDASVVLLSGYYFSTYYINTSIFLAFAATYPDVEVYLYFLIRLKMKWLGAIYTFFIFLSLFQGNWATRVAIVSSLLNFVIFFLATRNVSRYSPKEVHRRNEFRKSVKKVQRPGARHKCAVCGRTEEDGEHLEFRYCSKCNGNYEYCQDHLFTHYHVK